MKNLPLLFCGIFFALAFSFTGLILTSHIQIGSLTQTTETLEATDDLDEKGMPVMVMTEGEPLYPSIPVGLAQQGKEIYISMVKVEEAHEKSDHSIDLSQLSERVVTAEIKNLFIAYKKFSKY